MQPVDFSILSIDGAIDEPNMRRAYPLEPDEFFIAPANIARKVKFLFKQEDIVRSATIRATGNNKGIPLN